MAIKEHSVLAAFGQLNRDDEFRIITKILNDGSRTFVRKEAYTIKAVPHIDRMKASHEKLNKALLPLDNIRLVNVLNSGDNFIDFEYIAGSNVEYKTFTLVLSGRYNEAIDIIDRIFDLIDSLSSSRSKSESKAAEKINNIYRQPASSAKYIKPGIVDINLDNFILNQNDELVAFDYEWLFDQPIAADFVKTRLLYTFFARRSEAFAFLPNKTKLFKALVTDDSQTLIPAQLYTKYAKHLSKASMKKYWEAEDVFQKSVDRHHQDTAVSNITSFNVEEISTPRLTFPEFEESNRSHYDERVRHLEEHARNIENELTLIKSSSAYGVALKLRAAKNKLFFK